MPSLFPLTGAKMSRFSVQISDELNDWLEEQARLNHRPKNKQLEHILSIAQKMPLFSNEPRHTLGSPKMCYNGQHHFKQADPAASDFCNCGVFVFGEVVR